MCCLRFFEEVGSSPVRFFGFLGRIFKVFGSFLTDRFVVTLGFVGEGVFGFYGGDFGGFRFFF